MTVPDAKPSLMCASRRNGVSTKRTDRRKVKKKKKHQTRTLTKGTNSPAPVSLANKDPLLLCPHCDLQQPIRWMLPDQCGNVQVPVHHLTLADRLIREVVM
ncbi:uncharacterized protein V6R79_017684 [Siganus canaliculatus]